MKNKRIINGNVMKMERVDIDRATSWRVRKIKLNRPRSFAQKITAAFLSVLNSNNGENMK